MRLLEQAMAPVLSRGPWRIRCLDGSIRKKVDASADALWEKRRAAGWRAFSFWVGDEGESDNWVLAEKAEAELPHSKERCRMSRLDFASEVQRRMRDVHENRPGGERKNCFDGGGSGGFVRGGVGTGEDAESGAAGVEQGRKFSGDCGSGDAEG